MRVKALLALALTLFGTIAMAQEKWTTETVVDEFDDSVTVAAVLLNEDASAIIASAAIAVGCIGDEDLVIDILQPEPLQESDSEEIQIRFDDEAAETISIEVSGNDFGLTADEKFNKSTGNYESVELARRFGQHSKFRLRYEDVDLSFDYDQASAKDTIGKVFEHCGIELESETMVQLKWKRESTSSTTASTVAAILLNEDAYTSIGVVCLGGEILHVGFSPYERLQDSRSEEIQVRFDDEAVETISVAIHRDDFMLSNSEAAKFWGLADPVKLAKKFTRHSKFRLRYQGESSNYERITLTFEYDQASAKDAIGKVFVHCRIELESEPSASTETAID